MTILYHLGNPEETIEKEIATFSEYYDWLRSLGAGSREEYPETRTWWADDYRELLASDEVKPYRIGLPRGKHGGHVTILGRR